MSVEFEAKKICVVIKEIIKASLEFNSIVREITNYNTADGPNMNPNEMNKFRHIAASAYLVSKGYSEVSVYILGEKKEDWDILAKLGKTDRDFDVVNNKKGREIGKKFRYLNKKSIFDYIF